MSSALRALLLQAKASAVEASQALAAPTALSQITLLFLCLSLVPVRLVHSFLASVYHAVIALDTPPFVAWHLSTAE